MNINQTLALASLFLVISVFGFFALRKEKTPKKEELSDPNLRLVEMQIAGITHTFFQNVSFVENLIKAIETSNPGEFVELRASHGTGYIINLDKIDRIHIPDDVYKIESNDAQGCSVYIEGQESAVRVGDIPAEKVYKEISDKAVRFIRIGSHYFNRAEIALIVWFRSSSYANET
jgi:hypothetical protein